MIIWKLEKLLYLRGVSNVDLGNKLGDSQTAITKLKKRVDMPRINGERLEKICEAIASLSGKKVELSDLIEYVPER